MPHIFQDLGGQSIGTPLHLAGVYWTCMCALGALKKPGLHVWQKEGKSKVLHCFPLPLVLFLLPFMSSPGLEAASLQLELITSDGL